MPLITQQFLTMFNFPFSLVLNLTAQSCSCQGDLVFNSDFQCIKCQIPFCIKCSTSLICQKCLNGTTFIDGYCRCDNQTIPNINGQCAKCDVLGCLACAIGNPQQCSKCENEHAVLRDGTCECSVGYLQNQATGQCTLETSLCQFTECSECVGGLCNKCVDPVARVRDGRCKYTEDPIQDFNETGYAAHCYVFGCGKCSIWDPEICLQCLDPIAKLFNSYTCLCLNNNTDSELKVVFNSEEKCVLMKYEIEGCDIVNAYNPEICVSCEPNYELTGTICRYKYGNPVPGCRLHADQSKNTCSKCSSEMTLKNGWCYCQQGSQIPDANNLCVDCFAAHCQICDANNHYKCSRCSQNFVLSSKGRCQNAVICNVAGCRLCDGSDLCIQCIDIHTFLLDGQCHCFEGSELDEYGLCEPVGHNLPLIEYWNIQKEELSSLDWRQSGIITSVKDRTQNTGYKLDWVFTYAAYVESELLFRKKYQQIDLSEQYMLACMIDITEKSSLQEYLVSFPYDNSFANESAFPYQGTSINQTDECSIPTQSIQNLYFEHYGITYQQKLKSYLKNGPIMITLSNQFDISNYDGGIYSCTQNPSLSLYSGLLIGYTQDYWIVKYNRGIQLANQGYVHFNKTMDFSCGIDKDGYYYARDILSRECPRIPGCLICSYDGSKCIICTKQSEISEDQLACSCKSGLAMSSVGYCEKCTVLGCASCEPGNSLICKTCLSPLILDGDGGCVCEQMDYKINRNGVCEFCNVEGCQVCKPGQPSICQKCIDQFAIIREGACQCNIAFTSFNQLGICSRCFVNGCKVCTSSPFNCSQCQPGLTLSEGTCLCSDSNQFVNSEGECDVCGVDDCAECDENGQCSLCSNSLTVNPSDNICTECPIQQCEFCSSDNTCAECSDPQNSKLEDGKCTCFFGSHDHKFNSYGFCEECRAPYCQICKIGYESLCEVCVQNMEPSQGICKCKSGYTLNSSNICQPCNAQYCNVCKDGNREVCEQCSSKNLYIHEGKCVSACSQNPQQDYCQEVTEVPDEPQPVPDQQSLPIIIGCSVGVLVILIVIGGGCYLKKNGRSTAEYQGGFNDESAKVIAPENQRYLVGDRPQYLHPSGQEFPSKKEPTIEQTKKAEEYYKNNIEYRKSKKSDSKTPQSNKNSKQIQPQSSLGSSKKIEIEDEDQIRKHGKISKKQEQPQVKMPQQYAESQVNVNSSAV